MEKNDIATKNMIRRIAIIGPESTGKTTLCGQLAEHFSTVWIAEYAREYIFKLKTQYTLEDIEYCARQQIKEEKENISMANGFIFIDTELIVAKVWCEDVFHVCPAWIEEEISTNPYDYYLLTEPDLLWEKDVVRENGNRRDYFFNLYKQELEMRGFPYSQITGIGETRIGSCINALLSFFD